MSSSDTRNDNNDIFEIDPEWLETTVGDFRVWHIIAFCLGILLSIIIIVCCCFRFRIPRTKQEIEADFQRKQITKRFREKLQQIKNSEMDDMDLQRAIARIQADLLAAQSHENNTLNNEQNHNAATVANVKFKIANIQHPA